MAFKSTKAVATVDQPTYKATFLVHGALHVRDDVEGTVIELPCVELNIDYPSIEDLLIKAGVPKDVAPAYVGAFAEKIRIGELSRNLAERIEFTRSERM